MGAAGAAGQADDGAAAVHIPVGRAESGEGGHEVDIAVVRNLHGHRLGFGGLADELHFVAQPLNHRAADEHAALQRIAGLTVHPPADGGDQVVLGLDGVFAGVHQHEAAGAIGILAHAGREAALSEQRGVLIAGQCGDGDFAAKDALVQIADDLRAVHDLGQHLRGNVHDLQQLFIPALFIDVVQHGAGRVGSVGDVHVPGGQVPCKEAVDGAEAQLAVGGALAGAGNGIQHPLQLGAGEVSVGHQTGLVAQQVSQTVVLQALDQRRGAAALPDDGVAQWPARGALPQQRGFALVGDADGGDVGDVDVGLFHGQLQRVDLAVQNVLRAMLDPAGLGVDLRELDAMGSDEIGVLIEHDGAGAGGTLIQRNDILHNTASLDEFINKRAVGLDSPCVRW